MRQRSYGGEKSGICGMVIRLKMTSDKILLELGIKDFKPTEIFFTLPPVFYEVVETEEFSIIILEASTLLDKTIDDITLKKI